VNVHEKPAIPGIIAECIRYLTKKTTSKTQSLILIRVRLRARARAGARFWQTAKVLRKWRREGDSPLCSFGPPASQVQIPL
jgi:hypothetical protein